MKYASLLPVDHHRQSGVTLVELMIASVLGLFLTLGVTTLYIDSRQTDQTGAAMASIQESARIAMEMVSREIRMAGFQGCADGKSVTLNVIAVDPPTIDFNASALQGWEVTSSGWSPALDTKYNSEDFFANAVVGSDVIRIQRGISGNTTTDPEWVSNANIKVNNNDFGFVQDDAVMVSNCENADLFRITSNPSGPNLTWAHAKGNNTSNRLSTIYSAGGTVYRFSSAFFYVADTGRNDLRGNPIFALYRQTDNVSIDGGMNAPEELVEGIENLQMLYGERLSNDNIRYVTASNVSNWENVVSVRIGMLISAIERARSQADNQSYSLPGEVITSPTGSGTVQHAGDFRLRKTFTLSVTIRNRA